MSRPRAPLPALRAIAAAYTAATGSVVLLGWAAGLFSRTTAGPQYVSMKANAAACFVLAGASLWLEGRAAGRRRRLLAKGCGAAVAVVGVLTVAEHLLGVDLGIDQLLFQDLPGSGAHPGRMAPATSASVTVLGAALVAAASEKRRAIETAQVLSVMVGLMGLLGLLGYLYAVPMLRGDLAYTMSLPASVALIASGLGILALRPDRGLVAIIASDSAGGTAARRLLPWVVVAPLVIGGATLAGQRAGLYDVHLGIAWMVFGSVVVFAIVVWANAYPLHRLDRGRQAATAALSESLKRVEASEGRYRALMEHANDSILILDLPGRILEANRETERLLGRPREEIVGRRYEEFVAPEEREEVLRRRKEFVGSGLLRVENRQFVRADGRRVSVEVSGSLVRLGDESAALAILRDVTARKETESRLQDSEEQYRLLFDRNPHPMWVYDEETLAYLAVNDAAVRHYGYSRDEFLAMTLRDLRPAEEVTTIEEFVARRARDIKAFQPYRVWKHRKKDGSLIDVEVSGSPIEFRGRRAWLALATDVTEKKRLEAQLLQAQKMESVGRLAGGIAHDFNNLLGVISGYGELLSKRVGAQPRLAKYVDDIVKAADRASGLTRQLLAFSRKQVLQPRILDLNAVVGETETMLRRLIGEDVQLVTVFDEHLGSVRADPGQVDQVLMNLAVNARDAMPRGGRLTIETSNVALDRGYVRQHPGVEPGPYVMLAVSDTGHGMAPEVRARVFEPFFTTKEPGKGTGLGLATVHGIVKQSGGHIWVYSEPGQGTTFKIYLPRADEPEAAAEPPPVEVPLPRGSETVLLVEDEASLRELVRECLEASGYTVLEAHHGSAALDAGEHHGGRIHLLMTDVVMPGMSGRELAERLRASRPDIRILYMSGYTDDAVVLHGVLSENVSFIQKPFTAEALARRVREVLDASTATGG